jgi:serine/threonine-protein kinase
MRGMEAAFAPIAPGTIVHDTFKVLHRLAVGRTGEIYVASHARLPGKYVLKVLRAQASQLDRSLERFRREAEVTAALNHPHIVRVFDFNELPDGRPYIVMEHLEGRDLRQRLDAERTVAPSSAVAIVEQTASALAAAHGRDITHRDLKPANIFCAALPGSGREFVKVLDFGISKVKAAKITQAATVIGTPQYMSPEQARGFVDEVDPLTDQFALAAILYEMLSGRPPFSGPDETSVLAAVVNRDPPRLEPGGRAAALEPAILRALSKKKTDRYATVTAFAKAVAEAAAPAGR